MGTEHRIYHNAREQYVRDIAASWRRPYLIDPSVWLARDPEAEDKMLRDPDIAHAVGMRKEQIAGRQWTVLPLIKDSPRAKTAVTVATDLLNGIRRFTQSRANLARAFFSGKRYARIHGTTRTLRLGDGKPRQWWIPTSLEDLDARNYRVETSVDHETGRIYGKRFRFHYGPDRWIEETPEDELVTIEHVYQDEQATLGHGRGLREALGWVWYAKTNLAQELLGAAERYGQGILRAKIDGLYDGAPGVPNEERVRRWMELLEDMKARHVIVHAKDEEIDMLQMSGSGWELLDKLETKYRSTVMTLVLGANLTTAANSGGSYALAEVQENSTEARIQNDREMLEETLTEELLGCLWFKNRPNLVELGISEEKPRFNVKQEKRLDPLVRAQVASTLNGMGVDLAISDLAEQCGFREPEKGEPVIPGRQAMSSMGGFGGGTEMQFSRRPPAYYDEPPFGAGIDFAGKYDENKHDRDSDGKFAPKGEGGSGGEKGPKKEKPSKDQGDKDKEAKSKKKDADLVRSQYSHDIYAGKDDSYVVDHNKWSESTSQEEKDAIEEWSKSGYTRIRALQMGDQPRTPPPPAVTAKEMATMEAALARCPDNAGTFMRGMSLPKESLDQLAKSGSILELAAHSSWTSDKQTAFEFASQAREDDGKNVKVLFVADATSMKQISSLSQYQEEHESIGMRGMRFRVDRTEENAEAKSSRGVRVVNVYLKQIQEEGDTNVRLQRR